MYYLDSCICVDFLRGRLPGFRERLAASDPRLFGIPSVVRAELLLGAEKSSKRVENRLKVESFLIPFADIPFDDTCAVAYADIRARLERSGRPIGPNDMLIAATARAHGAALVTHNVREFKRVDGLTVIDWLEFPVPRKKVDSVAICTVRT